VVEVVDDVLVLVVGTRDELVVDELLVVDVGAAVLLVEDVDVAVLVVEEVVATVLVVEGFVVVLELVELDVVLVVAGGAVVLVVVGGRGVVVLDEELVVLEVDDEDVVVLVEDVVLGCVVVVVVVEPGGTGMPVHAPFWQWSALVQESSSLHGFELLLCTQLPSALQTSSVQALKSSEQVAPGWIVPWQRPSTHASFTVHGLESSQLVPWSGVP
jgi:hypothetical protein